MDTKTPPQKSALTEKQQLFVAEYCACLNASKAAIAAGYSAKTARQQGSRLLTVVDIKAAVDARLDELGMPAAEITKRMSDIGRADITDLFTTRTAYEFAEVAVPVAHLITELQAEIDFEDEYAKRAKLDKEEKNAHKAAQESRRRKMVRLQLQIEKDPQATQVVRQRVEVQVQDLDLTQARDSGAMRLVKSVKHTKHGLAVELYPADAALTNLARVRGLFLDKVEHTHEVRTVTARIRKADKTEGGANG